jgi:hypothetical protein
MGSTFLLSERLPALLLFPLRWRCLMAIPEQPQQLRAQKQRQNFEAMPGGFFWAVPVAACTKAKPKAYTGATYSVRLELEEPASLCIVPLATHPQCIPSANTSIKTFSERCERRSVLRFRGKHQSTVV